MEAKLEEAIKKLENKYFEEDIFENQKIECRRFFNFNFSEDGKGWNNYTKEWKCLEINGSVFGNNNKYHILPWNDGIHVQVFYPRESKKENYGLIIMQDNN